MAKNFESKKKEEASPEVPTKRSCGTMDVHRRLLTESESYVRERDQIENMALAYKIGLRAVSRTRIVQIPVVVHVVWNTEEQNISDAQIQSQIEVLNEDFKMLNPDVSQVPPNWTDLVADMGIEFFLATEDPDGNPTSGITCTQTSVTSFTHVNDKVKFSVTGGEDTWPADWYLNIWVCQLGGGLFGYAQFPGGPTKTDSVVITYTGSGITAYNYMGGVI